MKDFQIEKKSIFQCGEVICLVNKLNVEPVFFPTHVLRMKSSLKKEKELDIHKRRQDNGKLLRTGQSLQVCSCFRGKEQSAILCKLLSEAWMQPASASSYGILSFISSFLEANLGNLSEGGFFFQLCCFNYQLILKLDFQMSSTSTSQG